jgi:hypothetical protein
LRLVGRERSDEVAREKGTEEWERAVKTKEICTTGEHY